MLLPVSRPTDKFASPLAGLRSLLLPDTVAGAGGGGGVATRTIPAMSPCVSCAEIVVQESEEEEEDDGCWVPYGRQSAGRRRLPPPIPSLAARSAGRRARTDDRRLVISRARVMRPDYYVRARRVRGGRLLMRLVEREDDEDPSPAPDPLPAPTAREDNGIALADGGTTSVAADEEVDDAQAAAAPAPMPAVGCFEDVVKYQYAIGGGPLHQMPLPRMVH